MNQMLLTYRAYKERVVDGERRTYVIDFIQQMRKNGGLWTEEFIWHKKIRIRGNGPTGFVIIGND